MIVGLLILCIKNALHDRHVLARLAYLFEESEQVVGVRVREETIGPVGGGLGPQADADQVLKFGGEQGFQVSSQHSRLHDQGIPTGEEHAVHLAMLLQVVHQLFGLHALKRFLTQPGNVELHLSGGMGVESGLNPAGCRRDLLVGGLAPDQLHHSGEIPAIQHVWLRECQLVDGVVGNVLPADQFFDNIAVDTERQHRRHGLDAEDLIGRQSLQLRNPVNIFAGVGLVFASCYVRLNCHMLSWGLTRSGQFPSSSCRCSNSLPLPGQLLPSSVLSF